MSDLTGAPMLAALYDRGRLAAAAPYLPALLRGVPRWPAVGRGRRVIVLGGGVAGLCAAWSLRDAGFQPLVLERTARVGGRFYTCRDGFGGQYVELGVTRIPESHALTLSYARSFGLPLAPYPSEGTGQLYVMMGRRFRSFFRQRQEYPDDLPLSPAEKDLDAESLHHFYTAQSLARIGAPHEAGWPSGHVRDEFGGRSFYQSLDLRGASPAAKEICRSYDGVEIESFDALGWLANMRLDTAGGRSFTIPGGNDQLTAAFAAGLGGAVLTGAHVRHVERSAGRVSVGYVRGGACERVEGDYVICALPHRILAEICFDPPLREAKLQAAEAVPMFSVTRLNFQFSRRFWNLDEGLRGLLVACTTSPIERLWDLSVLQPGPHGVLAAYAQHHNAEAIDRLPTERERIEYGLSVIETFFPAARRHFLRGATYSWQQPWSRGGWAVFLPGQLDRIAALQRAEDRVHFAGDHTSLYVGWAQGALESAHCAVAEIIAACAGAPRRRGRMEARNE